MPRKMLLSLVIAAVLLTSVAHIDSASAESLSIKVQASGDVRVSPTKVKTWVGVQSEGPSAAEALLQSHEVIQDLLKLFAEFTTPELIKTSEFNMYQKERWDEETWSSIPEGFVVRHIFEIDLLDLSKGAEFLDQVSKAGVNIIYGLQYGTTDHQAPRQEAIKRAIDDAWWKAAVIAEATGAEGLVLETVEEGAFFEPIYASEGTSLVTELADLYMPGQLKVAVNITATFRADLPESK